MYYNYTNVKIINVIGIEGDKMLTEIVTKDFLRASFLADILPLLVSKQEKRLVLELKYNIVYITFDEKTEKFKFLFLNYNDLFDIDFSFFHNVTELDFRKIVLFTIEKPILT